jgi:hypothetical protein
MPLDYQELEAYASKYVVAKFYRRRIEKLSALQLKRDILVRKNPYLFKAKNITTSEAFVRSALDAFLSSQEETLFGNLLENLAIYICGQVFGGKKSKTKEMPSIDLEFIRDGIYYIVGIKSGIYWGNSDQINRMKNNFKVAKRKLAAKGVTLPIIAVNGCIYGKDRNPFKQDIIDPEKSYYKYCGQSFWELISGEPELYVAIIHPLDVEAKKRGPEFKEVYDAKINEMTLEFSQEFLISGQIDWERLIRYVSENRKQPS